MKTKYFFLIVILFPLISKAQRIYYDAAAFCLNGHVKNVYIENTLTYQFSQNGQIVCNKDFDTPGGYMSYSNPTYYSNNYLKSIIVKESSREYIFYYKIEFSYNTDGRLTHSVTYRLDDNKRVLEHTKELCEYSYDSFGTLFMEERPCGIVTWKVRERDKYGNYTKYSMFNVFEITKRTITYWDVNAVSPNSSTNIQPKAVFHGTRVGKIYNVEGDGRDKYDLFFQCNVSVFGIKGQQVRLIVYVDGPTKGKGLFAPNGRHKTSEGNVAIGGTLNARTDSNNTQWPQYTLTLPFSDLCLPDGNHTINVRWFARAQGKIIGNSEFQTVHFTKSGKEIANFYVEGGEATSGFY